MILYRIDARIDWLLAHDPQDGLWIAVCPSLNLNASGRSREELDSCMAEAVHLLFTDLHEDREFDQFLTDQGWTASMELGGSRKAGRDSQFLLSRSQKSGIWKNWSMPEPKYVRKKHLVNCLRKHGYAFKRQGRRREIWKRRGGTTRVFVPRNASIDSREAVVVLKQAGLSSQEIEEFLRGVELV